jgi:hypothetical protein
MLPNSVGAEQMLITRTASHLPQERSPLERAMKKANL